MTSDKRLSSGMNKLGLSSNLVCINMYILQRKKNRKDLGDFWLWRSEFGHFWPSLLKPRTFLWTFSQSFGHPYSLLNSAELSCSSEGTLTQSPLVAEYDYSCLKYHKCSYFIYIRLGCYRNLQSNLFGSVWQNHFHKPVWLNSFYRELADPDS